MKIKRFKKRLFSSLLLTVLASLFITTATTSAGWGDEVWEGIGEEFGEMFSLEEEGISFTQFAGELAELNSDGFDSSLTQSTDFREYVLLVVNFALGFLGLIAVIIVIYGGVLYVTAGGEEENTQKGKKAIQYAVIGLLIVLGSFAFVNTVIRGAMGEEEGGGSISQTGGNVSSGFNAAAESIRAMALEIYNGYSYLAEVTEEVRGIQNDAQKDTLYIGDDLYPSRSDILGFLQSVKSKVQSIQGSSHPFSTTYVYASRVLRKIDTQIDSVNARNVKTILKYANGFENICEDEDHDTDTWTEGFEEGLEGTDNETRCYNDGYVDYYIGLAEFWDEIQDEYADEGSLTCDSSGSVSDDDSNYRCLVKFVANDFAEDFNAIIEDLDELWSIYSNIESIGGTPTTTTDASSAYSAMSAAYADAIVKIESWILNNLPIEETGVLVAEGLANQAILYEEFSNMQFVDAKLSADNIEGAAPLVVTFDVVGSYDPAGGSIDGSGDNIEWDLAGTKTYAQLLGYDESDSNQEAEEAGIIDCEASVNPSDTEGEYDEAYFGATARRCIFHKPGTYTAAVKIKSNDPTNVAPGVAVITIKVEPPDTKINLNMEAGGTEHQIMSYQIDGQDTEELQVNRSRVTITTNQGKAGVTFDATATKNVEQYKWDGGNGEVDDFQPGLDTWSTKYTEAGKYLVTLEVINSQGNKDKKIFTLIVAPIAAILNVDQTTETKVYQPVTFDGSSSNSDLGAITNYSWEIKPRTSGIDSALADEISSYYEDFNNSGNSGADLKTLTHEFIYPISYDISLTVTNAAGEDTATIDDFEVKSTPPVAAFSYSVPDTTQPGTYYFDGSMSYDPDGQEYIDYEWSIEPSDQDSWIEFDTTDHGLDSEKPRIQFTEPGDYEVTLTVRDQNNPEENHDVTKTISVDNVLDLAWPEDLETVFQLEEGEVQAEFDIVSISHQDSDNLNFEVDFGDGSEDLYGLLGSDDIEHTYTKAGKFPLTVTIYDENDNENSITRNVFIRNDDDPLAQIAVYVDGQRVYDLSSPVIATKKSQIQFDASDSINTNGTNRGLTYSWNFGDTDISSQKIATHTYDELSPEDEGYYEVKLNITDEDDATKTSSDTVMINVINIAPRFSSVVGVPHSRTEPFETPVPVTLKAYGSEDEDGEIVKYRWWYFNTDTPDEIIDMTISQSPSAQLTIGTNGKEGEEITYGFGLEVTDNDNNTFSNEEDIIAGNLSTVSVVNGQNEMPTSDFSVTSTAIFAGEEITFTSAASDPDGSIVKYYWDFEGDGFFNNEYTEESSVKHTYNEKNLDGFEVRLKVIDDKGGEAISQVKKVYVDSKADPPVAAFTHEVIEGSNGMKIQFQNNSQVDEEAGAKILKYEWDFDTASNLSSADADGDGFKDNDSDSDAENPKRLYTSANTYQVKLTITDNQGNTDDVINSIKVPLADAPVAAFTHVVEDGKVKFTNTSTADEESDAYLAEFKWDFDSDSQLAGADSNGDGDKANDTDSTLENPEHEYSATGKYLVSLTVTDNQGNFSSVSNEVEFSIIEAELDDDEDASLDSDNFGLGSNEDSGQDSSNQTTSLLPVIKTTPEPDDDGIIYLEGDEGTVSIDFTDSLGAIATYSIDKNIYFDTDENGVTYDDKDFNSPLPGTWTTNFEREWGRIVLQLTVEDINGNSNSATVEIKFSE